MSNTVNGTAMVTSPSTYQKPKPFSTELDQEAFLKLLIEQLKNQDPLSPMDNQQFIQQTSMMTMVERLTRMQVLMEEANASLLNIRQYEGLIGRTATYEWVTRDSYTGEITKEVKTGTISAVKMEDGEIFFLIGGDKVPRKSITGIESSDAPSGGGNILDTAWKYAQLVGQRVTYKDQAGNEVTQVVSAVSVKNGLVEFVLENGHKLKPDEIVGVEIGP